MFAQASASGQSATDTNTQKYRKCLQLNHSYDNVTAFHIQGFGKWVPIQQFLSTPLQVPLKDPLCSAKRWHIEPAVKYGSKCNPFVDKINK